MRNNVHGRDATKLEIEMAASVARMQDEIHELRARATQLTHDNIHLRNERNKAREENATLRAQRDELATALRELYQAIIDYEVLAYPSQEEVKMIERARQALARVGEGG